MNILQENWRSVIDWPAYEVSDLGRARSLDRRVSLGRQGYTRKASGRILVGKRLPDGRRYITLCAEGTERGIAVCRLVLQVFVGPCPPHREACHRDDNPSNDVLGNLYWGTRTDNMHDQVRNGRHYFSKRTKCSNGHEYTVENTLQTSRGRVCRPCRRDRVRKHYAAQPRRRLS